MENPEGFEEDPARRFLLAKDRAFMPGCFARFGWTGSNIALSSNNFARTVSRKCSYRLRLPRAVNLKLLASMCTVTRRVRNCGKALGAHNHTVEFAQDTGPKIAKVGVKPLDDSDTTWLVVFRWCGWNHADRQVHSSSFIMGASLRPKGAPFRKDEPALEATRGELWG